MWIWFACCIVLRVWLFGRVCGVSGGGPAQPDTGKVFEAELLQKLLSNTFATDLKDAGYRRDFVKYVHDRHGRYLAAGKSFPDDPLSNLLAQSAVNGALVSSSPSFYLELQAMLRLEAADVGRNIWILPAPEIAGDSQFDYLWATFGEDLQKGRLAELTISPIKAHAFYVFITHLGKALREGKVSLDKLCDPDKELVQQAEAGILGQTLGDSSRLNTSVQRLEAADSVLKKPPMTFPGLPHPVPGTSTTTTDSGRSAGMSHLGICIIWSLLLAGSLIQLLW